MLGTLQRLPAKNRGRIVVAGIGLLVAADYTVASYKVGLGTLADTQSGMFPLLVGVAWMIVSILTAVEALKHQYGDEPIGVPRDRLRVVLLFAGMLVAMMLLLPVLGQYITAALFGAGAVRLLSNTSWPISLTSGAVVGVALSYLFIGPLGVILPTGPFGW